jgi:DNA polymerase-1
MKTASNDLVLIVDALNLFTRHFVAHPATGVNGEHVGGIVGFMYAIADFSERFKPSKVIVVWEGGGSSKKRSIYGDYKQKRRPEKLNRFYEDGEMPDTVENRNHQISTLVEIMKNLPIIQMYVPDCEADDVIGYISKYTFKNNKKLIISSDKDFYQLLDNHTIIYSPTWKKLITRIEVTEKFGISPENFCLAKAICGDPSDNIDGVDRVGFKTLAKRFPDFAQSSILSIQDITSRCKLMLAEGNNLKAIKNISESETLIKRNWSLIYLDTGNLSSQQISKIGYTFDNFKPSRSKISVMRILIREGIQTFNVDRLFLSLNHVGRT